MTKFKNKCDVIDLNISGPDLKRSKASGFSLVEISLALLVVSIGLLAIIGMFPASLSMGNRAIDETYASFFADSAIASFKGAVDLGYWDGNNGNAALENYLPIGPNTIDQNDDVFWKDSNGLRIIADGNVHVINFIAGSTEGKWAPPGSGSYILPSNWEMEDHSLRYRITIDDLSQLVKSLTIEVWMGEFGNINNEKPELFYTELYRYAY